LARDVTLESGLDGKPVLWRVPAQPREGEPLLRVNAIEGLRIRGFTLDGQGRVKDLVILSGVCPGFTMEEVQLRGFTHYGLFLFNCEGRADKPVHLARLKIVRSNPREVGMFFDALPKVREGVNQHIVVEESRVEGGGATGGVLMSGPEVLRDV